MRRSALFLLFLCAASTSARALASTDDVASHLSLLSSGSSSERSAAQRWLAAHLQSADRSALELALGSGDPEVRRRIVESLAAEDRLVPLAIALAASTASHCASTGHDALMESLERWSPGSTDPGLDEPAVLAALRVKPTAPILVDALLASAPLADVIDLLSSEAPAGCGIAVDASVPSDTPASSAGAIDGPFDAVLLEFAHRRALVLHGFGLGDDARAGAAPWILLTPRGRGEADAASATGKPPVRSAAARIEAWCLTVERSGDPRARSAAARALAGCGWPAAIAWLAERWPARDDTAALDGLLLAVGRERVAPGLFEKGAQDALRVELERALALGAAGSSRSIRLASALGATGLVTPGGENLLAPALLELTQLDGRALHARLVEIEARAPTDDSARRALDAVLVRADVAPATAWLALEARARMFEPMPALPRARELVEWAAVNGRLRDLARLLRGEAAMPPADWRDPAALPAAWSPRMRVFVARCWLARGEVDVAAAHVVQALAASDAAVREALGSALFEAGADLETPAFESLCARVLSDERADPSMTLRVVALARGAGTVERADRVLAALPNPAVAREDLLVLASLAAGPRGAVARDRLVEALRRSVAADDARGAMDRAIAELRAVRDEALERAFAQAVRDVVRQSPSAVRLRSEFELWPAPPAADRVRLADFDRSFARAGL